VKKIYVVVLIFFSFLSLNAYELPKLELHEKGKPEIIFFNAESVLVGEKLSYKLKWKTLNATDVNMTFFGKVDLSGSVTITEAEYNRGEIVLNASSKGDKYVDSFVINAQNGEVPSPVVFKKPEEKVQRYYNATPYRGRRRAYPSRRRYY
jgi:hypothetical protein